MKRLCAGGCRKVVTKGRCSSCQRKLNRKQDRDRGTANERGYNYGYQQARKVVLADDICHICGLPGAATVDHLVPRSLGGSNDLENLAPAHASCNYSRGNKEVEW